MKTTDWSRLPLRFIRVVNSERDFHKTLFKYSELLGSFVLKVSKLIKKLLFYESHPRTHAVKGTIVLNLSHRYHDKCRVQKGYGTVQD